MPDEKNQKKLNLNQRKTGNILQTTAPHLNLWSLKVKKAINNLSETPWYSGEMPDAKTRKTPHPE